MKIVTCHRGQLQTTSTQGLASASAKKEVFATGLAAIDSLLPHGGFARGAVHELLAEEGQGLPLFVASILAKAAGRCASNASLVWCDPQAVLYPPALAGAGIPLERLFLLRPKNEADEVWAVAECLRCKGVAATVASPRHLSRIQARRLQLAAEDGGGVGILLRRRDAGSAQYAAATRWLVTPAPGQRTVQRWRLELLHGHGGLIGKAVVLEVCRESNTVRASEAVGDRSGEQGRRQKAEGGNWQAAGPGRSGRVAAVGGGGVASGHGPWGEAGDDPGRSAGAVSGAGAPAA